MSDLKLMSTERQQQIVEAVKTAVDLVNDGTCPSSAIAKVATDQQLSQNEARLMVEAFNTSRTLAHLRHAEGAEKAASFDLADFDLVAAQAFPQEKVQPKLVEAYDRDQHLPSYHQKAAAQEKQAYQVVEDHNGVISKISDVSQTFDNDPSLRYRRAWSDVDYWRKTADAHRAESENLRFQADSAICELAQHFKSAQHLQQWPTFAKEAQTLHGPIGQQATALLEQHYGLAGLLARHGKTAAVTTLPDPETRQHKLLKLALLCTEVAAQEQLAEQRMRQKLADARQELARLGKSDSGTTKEASLMGLAALSSINQNLRDASDLPATRAANVDLSTDVGLESSYGNARLQMALQDMLEQDDVLSQHADENPSQITQAVKELSDLQPNILNHPIALRAALRRHLELGQTEPHELEQMRRLSATERERSVQGVQATMNPGGF